MSGNAQSATTKHRATALLTVREAAQHLGCSEANIYTLIDRGELVFVRIGPAKGYRIDPADLAAFIDSRKESKPGAAKLRARPRPQLKHIRLK